MALHHILYVCFFLSGAAGLLYEIYWAQRFGLLLGLDVYSHAAVLTAFMGGLALGSHAAGRRADRSTRPWLGYAGLELGIAVCGLLLPAALAAADVPLRWLYKATDGSAGAMTAARFLIAVALLLVPTSLMGATLPVMTRAIRSRGERLGSVIGRLYALNIIGAVCGVLAGGFILGEAIGLLGTNLTAVALNVVAAGLAWIAGRRSGAKAAPDAGAAPSVGEPATTVAAAPMDSSPEALAGPRFAALLIALGAGLTGAAGMMTQIGWTRVVSFCIGSSTYAFSLIVAVFLVGLAIGSTLAAWLVKRFPDAAIPWSVTCLLTAMLCWALMLPLGRAPLATLQMLTELTADGASAARIYQTAGLRALAWFALPTIALGATFPLACEAFTRRRPAGTARTTGILYAVNTIGAMVGSALGGLLLLDAIGIQGTLHAAAVLYAAAGAAGVVIAQPVRRGAFHTAAAATGLLALSAAYVFSVPWNRNHFIFGPFLLSEPADPPPRILYYREAAEGTVAIVREDAKEIGTARDNTVLILGGKPDASDQFDMGTQLLIGHLPMILHEDPRRVAVIGLGSGVTLHSVLTYPAEQVDIVEMSRAVIEGIRGTDGAPGPFDAVNGRALDDPRVHLICGDGRNHLALTDATYDVIVSEPSNPWVAGVAYLFTREHFVTCRQRLREGGILCQWLHSYSLSPREFLRVLQTVDDVFDSTTVWLSPSLDDYCLIATDRPRDARATVERWLQRPQVAENLRTIRIETAADLFGSFLLDCASLRGKLLHSKMGVFGELEPNTDNFNRLNYQAVRSYWRSIPVGAYRPLYDNTEFPRTWSGSLFEGSPQAEPLIRRIEDVQDAHRLMDWYQDTRKSSRARAAQRLGVETIAFDTLARRALEAAATKAPPPPDEADIALSIRHAEQNIADARAASDPAVRHRRARDARLFALLAIEGGAAGGRADVLLAEALHLMGRGDEARTQLARALEKGAAPDEEIRRQIEQTSPAP